MHVMIFISIIFPAEKAESLLQYSLTRAMWMHIDLLLTPKEKKEKKKQPCFIFPDFCRMTLAIWYLY